jgi:hypothetical protein
VPPFPRFSAIGIVRADHHCHRESRLRAALGPGFALAALEARTFAKGREIGL